MNPTLTRARYRALKKIHDCAFPMGTIGLRFTGAGIGLSGPTMVSLEKAGWIERADSPLRATPNVGTQVHYWTVTQAGRDAIKALPETEPKV